MPRKTFANGFPLPASDLNTYLMDQSVQTYASAAARTSAIATPIEGQVTYLEDTNLLYVWDGSAWTSVGQIADGSITNAKLANSSVSINGNSVALGASTTLDIGRNKIINGAFDFWQRGTSFTNPGVFQYTADRWTAIVNGAPTLSHSRQTFTPGAAPVAGYEGSYFLRQNVTAVSGSSVIAIGQAIEDVRTFAGQTVTLSFWAKADATRTWTTRIDQAFGSGGSTTVGGPTSTFTVTTSWQRFTTTVAVASISGKTIGTNSILQVLIFGPGDTVQTMDIWGVQLEAGSVATPFQRAAATLAGELEACQRYFMRLGAGAVGRANSSTLAEVFLNFPTRMRTAPTMAFGGAFTALEVNTSGRTVTNAALNAAGDTGAWLGLTTTGLTSPNMVAIQSDNNLLFSAEL